MTKGLADLLHTKGDERCHKFEALRYLLELQAIHNHSTPEESPSPFTVTITQLSVAWKWHRHTVTAFLNDLMLLGALTKEKTNDGFRLLFTDLMLVPHK